MMDPQIACDEVFALDEKIRYVAIFDDHLKKIAGGMREGLENILPEEANKVAVDGAFLRWRNRIGIQDWLGRPIYAFAEYEKVKRYSFYINEKALMIVSTERSLKNDLIVDLILKKLRLIHTKS